MDIDPFQLTTARVKGRALLLDIDYLYYDGVPVVRLWCVDEEKRFQITIGDFRPYCYVVPDGTEELDYLHQKIRRACQEAMKHELEAGQKYRVVLEDVERAWYGKPIKVVRLEVKNPRDIAMLRDALKRVPGVADVLEANIPFAKRFAVDRNIAPTSMIEYEGEERGKNVKMTPGSSLKVVGAPDLNLLRCMAWDMEVWNRDGFPTSKDPITLLTIATNTGEETICLEAVVSELHSSVIPDDYGVCARFLQFWQEYDADVIFTYNGDNFDWPHLAARLEHHGLQMPRGRDGVQIKLKPAGKDGDDIHVKMTGRANIDLYRVAKRDLIEVKQKGLDNVAEHLDIPTPDDWLVIPPADMWAWFLGLGVQKDADDNTVLDANNRPVTYAAPQNRETLKRYAITDAEATLGIGKKLLPLQATLSRFTYIPLSEIAASYRGAQVEYYLIRKSVAINQLVPNKKDENDDEEFEGATVLDPIAGLHEDVTGFDFSGLYPTIMDVYNISPETYVGHLDEAKFAIYSKEQIEEQFHVLPDLPPTIDDDGNEKKVLRHVFLKEPDGFLRSIIRELKKERKTRKDEMAKYTDGTPEYTILDLEQFIIKILTNSLYGYTGWRKSRWYFLPCAESVTGWGRWMLLKLKDAAEQGTFWDVFDEEFAKRYPQYADQAREFLATATEEEKLLLVLVVLYGDTDSVFVKGPKWLKALLGEWANRNLPVQVEWKENYIRVFFPGPKKRYCGMEEKLSVNRKTGEKYHKIVVKGLETKRGDWSLLARTVQEMCIEKILRDKDPEVAAKFAKTTVERLRNRDFDLKEITIRKGLTRAPDEYKAVMPHVEALKRAQLKDPNFKANIGDKLAYVVVDKPRPHLGRLRYGPEPPLNQRTVLLQFYDGKEPIDVDYYVEKQIIPAAMRLLDFYGYDDLYFKAGAKETTIFSFED